VSRVVSIIAWLLLLLIVIIPVTYAMLNGLANP